MVSISGEDYRALEEKIHREVQKIFSEFIEEIEQRESGTKKTGTDKKTPPARERKTKTAAAEKKRRTSVRRQQRIKKTFDTSRLLYGTARQRGIVLDDDIHKILKTKPRKKSA